MKFAAHNFKTILVLDTTDRDQTAVAILADSHQTVVSEPVRAQELQRCIVTALTKANSELNEIRAIAVLRGPGSLTGCRIGVTTANTLAWQLKVPIIEIDHQNFEEALALLASGQELPVVPQTTVVEQ